MTDWSPGDSVLHTASHPHHNRQAFVIASDNPTESWIRYTGSGDNVNLIVPNDELVASSGYGFLVGDTVTPGNPDDSSATRYTVLSIQDVNDGTGTVSYTFGIQVDNHLNWLSYPSKLLAKV